MNKNNKKFNWTLCADVYSFWDKIKISRFLFTEKIWTYGKWIVAYEDMWSKFLGGTHAVMVSSGSAANELIALRRKWELQQSGDWPKKNKVIVPVNTWISSVSPWIHAGFEIVFSDVSPLNLNVESHHISELFNKDTEKRIGTVFYTALLGFYGDINTCKLITESRGAKFLMDNCEATLSTYRKRSGQADWLLNFSTCSTSIFYSHFLVSGTEGGLVFCKSQEEADWYRMMRSHGLTRGMPDKYKNPKVSPMFDFALLGSNYRSSNLQAYMAMLDFNRGIDYSLKNRQKIFSALNSNLDPSKFECFSQSGDYPDDVIPLAIPIVCKTESFKKTVEQFCNSNGIETRPIIGGCLLMHTAFKGYGNPKDFPVALNAHKKGLYIGINKNITEKMAFDLAQELNKL